MYFFQITHWDRESVQSEKAYLEWLDGLQREDMVAVQKYYPPQNKQFGVECWRFDIHKIEVIGEIGELGDRIRYSRNGIICDYQGEPIDHGHIFPARVVPLPSNWLYSGLNPDKTNFVIGNRAIYEPLLPCGILYFLNRDRKLTYPLRKVLKEYFINYYEKNSMDGDIICCYLSDQDSIEEHDERVELIKKELAPLEYLYSDRFNLE